MNIIYHNPGKMVRIPSSRQLADILDMSRATVNLAFERLTAAGYLLSRQGSGTYTNPKRSFFPSGENHIPLVGISYFEGDAFFYNSTAWRIIASLGAALGESGCNVKLLQNGIAGNVRMNRSMQLSYLDAFVSYMGRGSELEEISRKMPIVDIGEKAHPKISGVILKTDRVLQELIKLYRREGCEECLLLRIESPCRIHQLGTELVAAGLHPHEFNIKDMDFQEKLRTRLMHHRKSMVIHYSSLGGLLEEYSHEFPGLLVPVSYLHPIRSIPYHGHVLDFPWEKIAELATRLLIGEKTTDGSPRREEVQAELYSEASAHRNADFR